MNIETYQTGDYWVFKFLEDVGLNSDLSVLKRMFQEKISRGPCNMALAFTQGSYLYTRSIATLVVCFEMVQEHNGHLALINPNKSIMDILAIIDFPKLIRICDSEEELLSQPASKVQSQKA
jgi:anti-anti-sigma regulatory factor